MTEQPLIQICQAGARRGVRASRPLIELNGSILSGFLREAECRFADRDNLPIPKHCRSGNACAIDERAVSAARVPNHPVAIFLVQLCMSPRYMLVAQDDQVVPMAP